jgi:uncharacterized membrane protein
MGKANYIPPGWSINPSSWPERLPLVIATIAGVGVASYMAAYQLLLVDQIWEPFFSDGSTKILKSEISYILPIPDAAIGAFGYFVDVLAGVIGRENRWYRMPWIVFIFGIVVALLGLFSIVLVILQPLMFNTWCTLCLISAAISVLIIGPVMDEVLASLQYLQRVKIQKHSIWDALWGDNQVYEKIK